MHPFESLGQDTQAIAVTTSSAATAITLPSGVGPGGWTLRVEGDASAVVYIKFGASTVTVTTSNGMGIKAGSVESIGIGPGITHIACIVASGTATLRITAGKGL